MEITTSNDLISCDGLGDYDWSDQAEEGPTNFAFMAYSFTSSNSEVSTDSNCSSSCLENVKILKEQNEQILKDLRISKLNTIAYKTCLESVEARLLVYKKNESVYEEDIKLLKLEIYLKEVTIIELRRNGMNVNTARPKVVVNAARPKAVLNAVKGNQVNGVKASDCWVWKPKTKIQVSDGLGPQKRLIFLPHVQGNPQMDLQDQGVIDSGCSRHMTWNMSYLTNFEEIDRDMLRLEVTPNEGKSQAYVQSKLAEVVNTDCYVQNRVLVIKPHNNTPYELFLDRKPTLGFMRPFGCPVTILNTIDHLGKFDGKANEGFFVGKNTPNIAGSRPNWLFDIDALTKSMNYKPVVAGNQCNGNAGTKVYDDAGKARMDTIPGKGYILLPLWPANPLLSQNLKSSPNAGFKPSGDNEKKITEEPGKEGDSSNDQEKEDDNVNNTNNVNTVGNGNNTNNVNAVNSTVNAAGIEVNAVGAKTSIELPDDHNIPELEDIVYSDDAEDVSVEADMNNLNRFMSVSPIPTTIIHKDHPVEQTIGDLNSSPQTRRMTKNLK
ncbi:ribonuclease H-like domain-containing protein [Tanacetum coccineum]